MSALLLYDLNVCFDFVLFSIMDYAVHADAGLFTVDFVMGDLQKKLAEV